MRNVMIVKVNARSFCEQYAFTVTKVRLLCQFTLSKSGSWRKIVLPSFHPLLQGFFIKFPDMNAFIHKNYIFPVFSIRCKSIFIVAIFFTTIHSFIIKTVKKI